MARLHEKETIATLTALGWTAAGSTAIATKTYNTAVGPKTALAYLGDFGPDAESMSLTGDYQSEGRNILEPHGMLLPKAAGHDLVRMLVTRFSVGVDAAVGQSYAARLLAIG